MIQNNILTRISVELYNELKAISEEENKSIIQVSRDLAKLLNYNRGKVIKYEIKF